MKRATFGWALLFLTLARVEVCAQRPVKENDSSLDDIPQKIAPLHPRNEAEQDRVKATALYAQGRLLLQREDVAGALKRFERAWRYDSESVAILREIVPAAAELERADEAARYAIFAAEADPRNEQLLRSLALTLTEREDFSRALSLYEKALAAQKSPKKDASEVLMRFEMGRLGFLTQQFAKAAEHFRVVQEAIASPKTFGLSAEHQKLLLGKADITYSLFGETYFQAHEYDAADAMYRKVNEVKPNVGLLAFHLARSLLARGKTPEAAAELEKYFAAKISNGGVEPYETLEKILLTQEKDKEKVGQMLREKLSVLREADPGNAPLSIVLGDRLRGAKQYDKAEAVYRDLLSIQPAAEAYQGLVQLYLAERKYVKLLEVLAEASSQEGGLQETAADVKKLADDKEQSAEFVAAAKKLSAEEWKKLPPGAAFAAGVVALDAKQFAAASEFLERAAGAGTPPKPQVYLAWGMGMFLGEKYDEAIRIYRRAIAENALPENKAHVHFLLSSALAYANQHEEAMREAHEAIKLNGKIPRYQSRPAWIKYHAKDYTGAAKGYEELLVELDKDHKRADVREESRESRLSLSHIYSLLGRLRDAEEMLEQVLDEFPDDVGAANDLSYLWSERGLHKERALKLARLAVEKEPDNDAYRDSLGWALFQQGKFAEALAEIQKAAGADKPDGVVLEHLGDVYRELGRKAEAKAAWKRALDALRDQKENEKIPVVEKKLQQD